MGDGKDKRYRVSLYLDENHKRMLEELKKAYDMSYNAVLKLAIMELYKATVKEMPPQKGEEWECGWDCIEEEELQ